MNTQNLLKGAGNIFLVFLILFFSSFIVSAGFGLDNENLPRVTRDEPAVITFNNNTGAVNSSDYWDALDTPSDISIFLLNTGDTGVGDYTFDGNITVNENIIFPSEISTIKIDNAGGVNNLVFDTDSADTSYVDFLSGSLASLRITHRPTFVSIASSDLLSIQSTDDIEFRLTDASGIITFNAGGKDADIIFQSNTNTNAGNSDGDLFGGKGAWGWGRAASSSAFFFIQPIAFESVANVDILALKVSPSGITVPTGTTSNAGTVLIDEPKLTADGTITNAFTLKIKGAPTEATNNYALWVNSSGLNRFDGDSNFTGLIYGNGSQLTGIVGGSGNDSFIANYTRFLTHINWSIATNGTLMLQSSWNATNISYRTLTNHTFPYVIVLNNGTDNVFIGDATTGNNGLADSVVVIGHGAGASMLATGDDNVLVGFDAGAGLTTGSNNVLVGYKSGDGLTTSNSNVFIGVNTGTNMTTSIGRSTLVGVQAGQYMSGDSNTAVGYLSGSAQGNTGNNGVYFGYQAGASNTIGSNNLYFGYNAGEATTTGGGNMFIGVSAGVKNIDGGSNTYVGNFVATQSTTGDKNLVMGANAGKYIMGNDNFIMGYNTGDANGIASPNFIVGNLAGTSLTGKNNLLLGNYAGRYLVDINNTLIIDGLSRGNAANDLTNSLIIGDFHTIPSNQNLTFNANTYINGNLNQTNGNLTGNMIHGSMAFHNDSTGNVTALTEDVWTNFTGFDQESNEQMLNGIAYSNSILTIQIGGVYDISFGTSFSGTVNNKYHVAIGINGAEQLFCESHDRISTGTDILSASFNCLKRLSVGDKIMLMYMNEDSAGDTTTLSAQLKATRIGN